MNLVCFFIQHAWNGCVCARCGETRDREHDWDGCTCRRCGMERHSYDTERNEWHYAECPYEPGTPCQGLRCGRQAPACHPGPTRHYVRYVCRKCGIILEETKEFDPRYN